MTLVNYFNNTGGLNKFASVASLNESEKKTEWLDAQNVEGHKSGGIVKMKGNTNVCFSSLPAGTKILGIWDYVKGNNHYPIINTSEGNVYKLNLDTGTLELIYSGLSITHKCCYANYNNGVIITNGYNTPLFYEENAGAYVLSGNAPAGLSIEVYKARVFIASGSTLHYSALGNQNDWITENDAGYISNFHNDSSPITAIKNYGEFLAIYKAHGTYILSGSSPDDFVIKPVADKGSCGAWGIGTIDDNQFFFSGDSITPLRFNELGQIRLADDISIKIKPVFDDFDSQKYDQIVCIPYKKKNQIWFYFASKSSSDLDVCYVYDYFHRAWYLRKGIPIICGAVIDGVIYTGTSDGRILREDYSDSFDGLAIEAWWFSPWFTFGHPSLQKEFNVCNIWVYQDQKYPLEFIYSKDYNGLDQKFSAVSLSTNTDLNWDQGLWDNESWTSSRAVKKKVSIKGACESLQIGVRNLEAEQPFAVIGYSFDFELVAE